MTRRLALYGLLTALALAWTGCATYVHPLTGYPSKDINTWLLGVWSYKDDKGVEYHATVIPLNGSHYSVALDQLGKNGKPVKSWLFNGWISRVGTGSFLTLRCDESGDKIAPGEYAFVHYQVIDQNHVVLRGLALDSAADASSMSLRMEVRRKQRDKTLYQPTSVLATRISEIYWDPKLPGPQPMQPLRYPPPLDDN